MTAVHTDADRTCPCGAGAAYDRCCGRLHRGEAEATTAEQLMRSRYAAYVRGDAAYLRRSWAPATRPAVIEPEPTVRWTGLDVLATHAGGPFDTEGTVEFAAHHDVAGRPGVLHEVSRFVRHDGRWVYAGPAA